LLRALIRGLGARDQNLGGTWPLLCKPRQLPFAQDGTLYVTGIHWVGWNSPGATGCGLAHDRGCIPNCAQGQTRVFGVSIIANRGIDIDGFYVHEDWGSPADLHIVTHGETRHPVATRAAGGLRAIAAVTVW
jgi:hypothetical protein